MRLNKIIFLLVLFTISNHAVFGQGKVIIAEYSTRLAEDGFDFDSRLIVNGQKSLFQNKANPVSPWELEGNEIRQTVYTDSIGEIVYRENIYEEIISVRTFCFDAMTMVFQDTVEFSWMIKNSFKEIDGVKCRKAITEFRGRKYTVYYNPEIPSFVGPWKFSGLPGLIYEITDKNNEIDIRLRSVTFQDDTPRLLDEFYAKLNTKGYHEAMECLDREWEKRIKKEKALAQRLQAEYPNIEIELDVPKRRPSTELDYE